jgi:hypothetical protein
VCLLLQHPCLSEALRFCIGPIQPPQPDSPRCIWLPEKIEADWLFESYVKNVTYLKHVIHVPSMRTLIDQVYSSILRGEHIIASHVALALSIFTSSAYYFAPSREERSALSTNWEDASQAIVLTRSTLDVLEYSRRSTSVSIEDVQATIILSFVMYNLEGFSARARMLGSTAFLMARELALHRIDNPRERERTPGIDNIKLEVSRRVWWHIVSTDWFAIATQTSCNNTNVNTGQ